MWGVSFVFVSNKSGWLSDSTTYTNLKIFGAWPRPCLGAYSYTKTPTCPLPRFAQTYFWVPQSFLHRYASDINNYNRNKNHKILITSEDIIVDIFSNKKIQNYYIQQLNYIQILNELLFQKTLVLTLNFINYFMKKVNFVNYSKLLWINHLKYIMMTFWKLIEKEHLNHNPFLVNDTEVSKTYETHE